MTDPAFLAIGSLLGAGLGSFANVCIYRIPRGQSVAWPGSRCPRCRAPIAWYHNIPVASYLALRARCARCRRRIAARYPLVEALMACLFLAVCLRSPDPTAAVLGGLFTFFLVVLSVIDLDWQIIPDVFSLGLTGTALAVAPLNAHLGAAPAERAMAAGAGALVGFASAWALATGGRRVFRREALGGGDVKLLAGIGAFLGWRGVVTAWFLASVLGTMTFGALKLRGKMSWGGYLAFGPFLAGGAWIHWAWPGLWDLWWGF